MNCIIFCGLNDSKVRAKLYPLILSKNITQIYLIRDEAINLPKVTCLTTPKIIKKWSILKSFYKIMKGIWVSSFNNINFVLGVFFIPHGLLALFLGKFLNTNTVASLIGTDINSQIPNSHLLKNTLLLFDTLTVTGSESKKKLESMGVEGPFIEIIPSVISPNFFYPKPLRKKYDLIFVGNLTKNKRIDLILKAISKSKYDLNLLILGSGELLHEYSDMAKHLDIDKRVFFKGFKRDVRPYLNKSKIMIMASEKEGLPQCMMEAMSCGIPCIAPKINDIEDLVINEKNSLLFEPLNLNDLQEKIDFLLSNLEFYSKLSINARSAIESNFSIEQGRLKWEKVFSQHI